MHSIFTITKVFQECKIVCISVKIIEITFPDKLQVLCPTSNTRCHPHKPQARSVLECAACVQSHIGISPYHACLSPEEPFGMHVEEAM